MVFSGSQKPKLKVELRQKVNISQKEAIRLTEKVSVSLREQHREWLEGQEQIEQEEDLAPEIGEVGDEGEDYFSPEEAKVGREPTGEPLPWEIPPDLYQEEGVFELTFEGDKVHLDWADPELESFAVSSLDEKLSLFTQFLAEVVEDALNHYGASKLKACLQEVSKGRMGLLSVPDLERGLHSKALMGNLQPAISAFLNAHLVRLPNGEATEMSVFLGKGGRPTKKERDRAIIEEARKVVNQQRRLNFAEIAEEIMEESDSEELRRWSEKLKLRSVPRQVARVIERYAVDELTNRGISSRDYFDQLVMSWIQKGRESGNVRKK